MFSRFRSILNSKGQATVESALMIPVVMLLLLLLIQPGIVLYDRMVMKAAAAEGCRLLATTSAGSFETSVKPYILRHLGAIPPQESFHVHAGGCSWDIAASGDESSDQVAITIKHEVKPLPLLGSGAALLGLTNGAGNIVVEVQHSLPTQAAWVHRQGSSPQSWPGAWQS